MKKIIINHFLDYEFIYIFFFSFLLFLLTSIVVRQKTIRKLTILLFSIFIVFSLFELSISIFNDKNKIEYNHNYLNKMADNINIDREIEFFDKNKEKYKIKNNKDKFNIDNYDCYEVIYDVIYSTYDDDFRQTKGDMNSKDVYIFLGCSFVFGDGLNDDETLPYFFSKLYNFEKNIINCGVQSVSTNSVLNIINNELFLPLINNKNSKIKHCFYSLIDDHIYRNFRYEGFCLDGYVYKDNKWYIPTAIGKMKCFFAKSYIFRKVFVPIIDEYFKKYYEDYMIKSLEEMNEIVEKKYNSKLTIIVWPEFDESFIDELKGTNLDLIFLPDYFNFEEEDYKIKYDGHPTAKANEEIAEILCNHINENKK